MATRDTVLFVSLPRAIGGSNRSLVTLLESLDGKVRRVLASPRPGTFADFADQRGVADEWFGLAHFGRLNRIRRLWDGVRLAVWAVRNRKRLLAIHANATTGVNTVVLAAMLSRRPVVAWIHDPVSSRWGRRLGPWVRRLIPNLTVTAVSETAARVAAEGGLVSSDDAIIVPNPLDPRDVVATAQTPHEHTTIAILGGSTYRKGFDLVPAVAADLADLDVQWQIYILHRPTEENAATWAALEAMGPERVDIVGRVADVRVAYAAADIVFVPSREESFCRIAAEAMMNGIPVVATDIPPLRHLLGDGAGLLFPPEDTVAAAEAIRSLVTDSSLRKQAGAVGRKRGEEFLPEGIGDRMLELYSATR